MSVTDKPSTKGGDQQEERQELVAIDATMMMRWRETKMTFDVKKVICRVIKISKTSNITMSVDTNLSLSNEVFRTYVLCVAALSLKMAFTSWYIAYRGYTSGGFGAQNPEGSRSRRAVLSCVSFVHISLYTFSAMLYRFKEGSIKQESQERADDETV